MKRFGRRMGWLGWLVAAALALSAGGAALAASPLGSSAGQLGRDGAAVAAGPDQALERSQGQGTAKLNLRERWGRLAKAGRRAVHGQFTVQTDAGFKTVVFARGTVTAVSDSSLVIASPDKVSTTFTLNAGTRYGTRRQAQQRADLKVGARVAAFGERSGNANTATRVVVLPDRGP